MKKAAIFLLFFSFILVPQLWAQEAVESVWQAANSQVYGTKLGGMLGRGILNVATCFMDVIVHVVEGSKQGPPFVGSLTGLGSGIGCTALRVTSGALDLVTFWVPGFNGFPVSRSYSNCLTFEEGEKVTKEAPRAPAPSLPAFEEPAPKAPKLKPEEYTKPAAPRPELVKRDVTEYVKK